jgi:hypothetical protein
VEDAGQKTGRQVPGGAVEKQAGDEIACPSVPGMGRI